MIGGWGALTISLASPKRLTQRLCPQTPGISVDVFWSQGWGFALLRIETRAGLDPCKVVGTSRRPGVYGAHAATTPRPCQTKSPSNSSSRAVACQEGRGTSAERAERNAESFELKIQPAAFHLQNLAPEPHEETGSGVRFSFCSCSKPSPFVRTFFRSARNIAISARDGLIMRNP